MIAGYYLSIHFRKLSGGEFLRAPGTGILLLAASVVLVTAALFPKSAKRNLSPHKSTLSALSCQYFIVGLLATFSVVPVVPAWQGVLVLVGAFVFILSVLHQLWKIKRFPKRTKPGLLGKRIHPSYIFLIFLWCAVVPTITPFLPSDSASLTGVALFALMMCSLFGSWLFVDNERSLQEALDGDIWKNWFLICLGFAFLSAAAEFGFSEPHWYLYAVSVGIFVGSSRMAASVWQKERAQSLCRSIPRDPQTTPALK